MPFGLKNFGATFQRAMSYAFHDLTHIILAYLDDLTERSKKRHDHLNDLRYVFEICRQINIRLNPHKCIFCLPSGRLHDFIVSKNGIQVDLWKFAQSLNYPDLTLYDSYKASKARLTSCDALSPITPLKRKVFCAFWDKISLSNGMNFPSSHLML